MLAGMEVRGKAYAIALTLLVASHAGAQAPPPYAPPPYAPPPAQPAFGPPAYAPQPYYLPPPVPLIPIWIFSDVKGPTYELRRPADDKTLFFCRSASCVAYLPADEYYVYVPPSDEYAEGKRKVKVERPSQLLIEPRDASDKTTGLAMGVGGIVLVVAGFTAFAVAADQDCEGSTSCNEDNQSAILLGVAGIIVGAILTPIGWVTYGKSFRPGVKVLENK